MRETFLCVWSSIITSVLKGRELHQSAWADTTMKYCNKILCGQEEICFLIVLEARKSKMKVQQGFVSVESSPPGLQMVTFLLCLHIEEKEQVSGISSHKGMQSLQESPTLMTPNNPNNPPHQSPQLNTITLGFRVLTYGRAQTFSS